MTKEIPILFNGEMVRAILEGRKTVTRRPLQTWQFPGEDTAQDGRMRWSAIAQRHARYGFNVFGETESACAQQLADCGVCPFGKPGDVLWVRETTEIDESSSDSVNLSRYAADKAPVFYSDCEDPAFNGTVAHWDYPRRSRPSIHMPRRACRIHLKITDVRVERLHQMQTADFLAEGCQGSIGNESPVEHFRHVWDSTGGQWSDNPWVWVIEFDRADSSPSHV